MTVETMFCDHRVRVTIAAPITKLCPYRQEVDHGSVRFGWITQFTTYELHSLAEYLGSFAERRISHEEITKEIATEFMTDVTTRWQTAGLEVEVCSSLD